MSLRKCGLRMAMGNSPGRDPAMKGQWEPCESLLAEAVDDRGGRTNASVPEKACDGNTGIARSASRAARRQ